MLLVADKPREHSVCRQSFIKLAFHDADTDTDKGHRLRLARHVYTSVRPIRAITTRGSPCRCRCPCRRRAMPALAYAVPLRQRTDAQNNLASGAFPASAGNYAPSRHLLLGVTPTRLGADGFIAVVIAIQEELNI